MAMQHSSCNEACAGGAIKRVGRLCALAAAALLSSSLVGCQSDGGSMADSRAEDRIDRAHRVDRVDRDGRTVRVDRADRVEVYRNPSMTYGVPQDGTMYGYLDDGVGFYQDNYWGD